jgi:hypothetical protein
MVSSDKIINVVGRNDVSIVVCHVEWAPVVVCSRRLAKVMTTPHTDRNEGGKSSVRNIVERAALGDGHTENGYLANLKMDYDVRTPPIGLTGLLQSVGEAVSLGLSSNCSAGNALSKVDEGN